MTEYTPFDRQVIALSKQYHQPLMGGTAVELLADHYGRPAPRPRTDNDLDFIHFRTEPWPLEDFLAALDGLGFKAIPADEDDPIFYYYHYDAQGRCDVEVDVARTMDNTLASYLLTTAQALVLDPVAQLKYKLGRLAALYAQGRWFPKLATDQQDGRFLQALIEETGRRRELGNLLAPGETVRLLEMQWG
jgi:hypothetical protein